jgi:hypothetical protein
VDLLELAELRCIARRPESIPRTTMAPFSLRCWKNGDCSTLEAMIAVEWLVAGAGGSELGARLYRGALAVAFPAVVGPRRAYLMQLACLTSPACYTTALAPPSLQQRLVTSSLHIFPTPSEPTCLCCDAYHELCGKILLWSQSFPVRTRAVQPIELVSDDFIRGGLLVASQEMDLKLLVEVVLGATHQCCSA